ncbi:MAG: glycosyltransferase, partial [Sulfobacillus sp.]
QELLQSADRRAREQERVEAALRKQMVQDSGLRMQLAVDLGEARQALAAALARVDEQMREEAILRRGILDMTAERSELAEQVRTMVNSRSWRITKPLRFLYSIARHLRHPSLAALTLTPSRDRLDGDGLDLGGSALPNGARRRLLIISDRIPTPDRDSGSLRMRAIIEIYLDLGFEVWLAPEDELRPEPYTSDLTALGIKILGESQFGGIQSHLVAHGAEYDVVMICRVDVAHKYMSVLRQHCPSALIIFDTVDLHYLRELRRGRVEGSSKIISHAENLRDIEIAVAAQADVTLVVSELERNELLRQRMDLDVRVVSNVHSLTEHAISWAERHDIVFVGGFKHAPNVDAAIYFVEKVLPVIREQLPQLKLFVIGDSPPPEVLDLAQDGVVITGFVRDIAVYLDHCRLSVAPLRYGAGVKGKVSLSMSFGVPVVATSIATEGMHLEDRKNVLIGDTPEKFAACVVELYSDEKLWSELSSRGREHVVEHFSAQQARESILALLQAHASSSGN